jgi:uncharacterized protein Yka (UPF0111/DUF47 family)
MKSEIMAELGQPEILVPDLVAAGLSANNRAKVRMSALQGAAQHARHPAEAPIDLAAECRAAGLEVAPVASMIAGASLGSDGRITAPGLGELIDHLFADVGGMIRGVEAGAPGEGSAAARRLATAKSAASLTGPNEIDNEKVSRLTAVPGNDGDSLHRLIMDLHKLLNKIAAAHAEETVAGAHVYGLLPGDRPIVEAFMRGVDETRGLKFDHPGLDTTAMRVDARLIIQNDIGATDAHVVVIAVDSNAVTVTYTDVHVARAKFFIGLFDDFRLQWSGLDRRAVEGLANEGVFYLVTGCHAAETEADRNRLLTALGAGLVFLIDWNKARKVLRNWISNRDAVHVLRWSALHRFGHRALLELGGGELVAAAVRHATPTRIGFGERLDTVLGREAAVDFLKCVLRISTQALRDGESIRLVRDRVEAELVRHLDSADSALFTIIMRQAGLAYDIVDSIVRHVADLQSGRSVDGKALAARASRMEQKADRILIEARNEVARLAGGATMEQLVNRIEDAIDELEQAAFILSLVPEGLDADVLKTIAALSAAALSAARAAAAGTAAAAEAPEGRRADTEDALAAVRRLGDAEHAADQCERRVTELVLGGSLDLKASLSVLELARAVERATDRLSDFGHLLSRHVLADLAG